MKKILALLLLFPSFVLGNDLRYTGTLTAVPQPASGSIMRSNGTSWLGTTATFADTYANGGILFSNGTNTVQGTGQVTYGLSAGTFAVAAGNPGGNMTLQVSNVDSTSGASNAVNLITAAGTGGGDALTTWTLTGLQSWSAGADISASNAWKLSAGTALGTNDVISCTTSRACTLTGNFVVGSGAGATSGIGLSVAAAGFDQVFSQALNSSPVFPAAVTFGGVGVYAANSTAASAFTMTNSYGMRIGNATIGAGSAITNNYGLYIDAMSGGGTLNRAIHSAGGTVTLIGLTGAAGTPNSICQNSGTGEITVNAALTCTVSSARFKSSIAPFDGSGLNMVAAMQPDTFFYNDRKDRHRLGLVAEDLARVDPRLSEWDEQGRPNSIDFPAMMATFAKAIQEQQAQIEALQREVAALRPRMATIQ